jgi:hypothetical protein
LSSLFCSSIPQLPQANGTAAPSRTAIGVEDTPTPVTIPSGWKISTEETGACQVATPPDWQLGSDFFLAAEKADPGPFESAPGAYPPSGLALWGIGTGTPVPQGHRFQIRTSLVSGDKVCSVWRIKADTDFTEDEKSQLQQVGTTLQAVQ